ncbi:Sensor histidine kinase RcsC [Dyadobacter sp. CECT 9275]|uniref:histidine kinase n=2 Tax=Dyadobacter helix TaxID=2822344 RepID=A0A916N4X2_9BACT|nr:Sensor histidine kinase RcsC [Dyadobacter sp. CECT 9275]
MLVPTLFGLRYPLNAQVPKKPVRILTPRDGLPQSFVSGLIQDKNGFVWVGTRNGLARYDGINFKVLRHDNKDTSSLSSNVIISLSEDKKGLIGIEHESLQIDVMDPATEAIEQITSRTLFTSHPVKFVRRGWLRDFQGNLWVIEKANGIYKYDWRKGNITHFTKRTHGFLSDTIRGLFEDKKRQIWVVSQKSISRLSAVTGRFVHTAIPFGLDFNNYVNAEAEVVRIYERRNGEIMFGDRKRLVFFNPLAGNFRTVTLPVYPQKGIKCIQAGPDGYDYVEADGNVYRYENEKGLVKVGDIGKQYLRAAESFLIDRSGLIWLGTDASGIHQIDLTTPFFESSPGRHSFHYDLLKQEMNISLDQFSGWSLSDNQFGTSSYFFRSVYDDQRRVWIALRDKVGYYDPVQKTFTVLPPVPGVSSADNPALGVRGIDFTPDGTLWVIGYNGFVGKFDSVNQKWVTFLASSVIQDGNEDITLVDLAADKDKLWITTRMGDALLCVDIKTKQIGRFNRKTHPDMLPTDMVQGMQQDVAYPELLWIGTYEGLVRLNKKTLKSEIFTMQDGLPDNTIYSVEADKAGYLWLSTNKGLCRFHPVSHQVQTFHTGDGLPGDEFNRFHHFQLPDGRLAFGGTEGWTLFDPTAMKADYYHPQVAFTSLKINNLVVDTTTSEGHLPGALNHIKKLSLSYAQNTLSFEFAGLEFNRPGRLRYRYQLAGYDESWLVTGNNPVATYTKLPPGNYLLRINSSNTTGQWSPLIRELAVVIHPPFWQTWWAYLFYAFLVGGLIWGYIRYLVNRERLKQEVILRETEANQLKILDTLKTKFFSDITHEFRTPLTLILTPAQRLKQTLATPDQLRWLTAIERNAYQLLRLINQLLDLSKLESGSLKITESVGDVGRFVSDQVLSFSDEADRKGVKIVWINSLEAGAYWFDVEKLERIILNLISNALKFTPRNGTIEIALSAPNQLDQTDSASENTGILLSITNTGMGIPEDKLPHIFDRFYQVDTQSTEMKNDRQPYGTGIGLSLVKELVDLQHGKIEVTSLPEDKALWRTCFRVSLPYRLVAAGEAIVTEPIGFHDPSDVAEATAPLPGQYTDLPSELSSVLLVEDNTELAEFIADTLPSFIRVSFAANGAEGMEKALEALPDLIISDVLMPVMDGFTFCRKLKEDQRTSHIPVILLTAKAAFDDRLQGLTTGADDYLTKPFHIQELQLKINNLLERQQRMRERMRVEISSADSIQPAEKPLPTTDPFISRIYEIMDEKLDDTAFGVEELSLRIGMSRASLHRKVKVLTDMAPGDIMRNYRLKRAAQFLKEGYNSSETAYKVGFDSPAYFSKCFREFYQMTPHEYAQA